MTNPASLMEAIGRMSPSGNSHRIHGVGQRGFIARHGLYDEAQSEAAERVAARIRDLARTPLVALAWMVMHVPAEVRHRPFVISAFYNERTVVTRLVAQLRRWAWRR